AFFLDFAERLPAIRCVELLAKPGAYTNELSKFRYDVILHVGREPEELPEFEQVSWSQLDADLATVGERLRAVRTNRLGVSGFTDSRQALDLALTTALQDLEEGIGVEELRTHAVAIAAVGGADPGSLAELAAAHGYAVELHLAEEGRRQGVLDAVFYRAG